MMWITNSAHQPPGPTPQQRPLCRYVVWLFHSSIPFLPPSSFLPFLQVVHGLFSVLGLYIHSLDPFLPQFVVKPEPVWLVVTDLF